MKKAVLIKSDLTVQPIELTEPLHRSLHAAVGGLFEIVRPIGLKKPSVFVSNECSLLLDLPINEVGCYLYGTYAHSHPIAGDIVIMKEGVVNDDGEWDLIGLDDHELTIVLEAMSSTAEVYRHAQ